MLTSPCGSASDPEAMWVELLWQEAKRDGAQDFCNRHKKDPAEVKIQFANWVKEFRRRPEEATFQKYIEDLPVEARARV